MNQTNPLYAATGLGGGLSLGAFIEWAKSPSALGLAAFVGSALSTGLSWYLARRREVARANLEIERERRAMEREQRYLDAIAGRAAEFPPIDPIPNGPRDAD